MLEEDWRAAMSGDQEALGRLHARLTQMALRVLRHRLGFDADEGLASDVALQAIERFDPSKGCGLESFLHGTVRLAALRERRRQKRLLPLEAAAGAAVGPEASPWLTELLGRLTPEDAGLVQGWLEGTLSETDKKRWQRTVRPKLRRLLAGRG